MPYKNFISGLEEMIARFVALIISIACFTIYASARGTLSLDPSGLAGIIGLFWLLYEIIAYILFIIFSFFSKERINTNATDSEAEPQTTNEN